MKVGAAAVLLFAGLCCWTGVTNAQATQALNPLLPTADVLIDVGHGGIDSGTMFGKYEEKEINLAVSKKTYKLLRKMGFRTAINRTTDYALSDENTWSYGGRHRKDLAQRSGIANTIKPGMMLSMHVNWSGKPDRHGPLVISQNQSESILLANLLQHSLNELYGTHEEPVTSNKYFVLRYTKCPAVIIEMGFISNKKDRKLLRDSTIKQKSRKLSAARLSSIFLWYVQLRRRHGEQL
ncbi:N-acetylmuramoyl-L-alanine amidase family protein [Paenibacillus hexagrammi]|uniref:N-acetylmuramoyl-L-alanine amidase n=1 Tax=Paenibacillus hexagrammi TaxID=2908839 RepID=A0ABY3SFR3_9BACL|nr:N-acetylmuramoyl-L-alanine amidase [Paenibacillus sp. YPD9-1]UJF32031.1 N-acetylmuramoyl-L-alanine amidase [Paenibacillus sp. YPD9-1]